MDLRQLAALVAVADRGTFSAAAESLHTVQSNVSSHVARLERKIGVTLVDRAHGCLTDEGRAVVERARRIKGEPDALVFDVGAIRSDMRGPARRPPPCPTHPPTLSERTGEIPGARS